MTYIIMSAVAGFFIGFFVCIMAARAFLNKNIIIRDNSVREAKRLRDELNSLQDKYRQLANINNVLRDIQITKDFKKKL